MTDERPAGEPRYQQMVGRGLRPYQAEAAARVAATAPDEPTPPPAADPEPEPTDESR